MRHFPRNAFCFPDFLVRTADAIYMVETKSQQQTTHSNVQRTLKAAATWCKRINDQTEYDRSGREWHYALVSESIVQDWRSNGARLGELLAFSRIRPVTDASAQGALSL